MVNKWDFAGYVSIGVGGRAFRRRRSWLARGISMSLIVDECRLPDVGMASLALLGVWVSSEVGGKNSGNSIGVKFWVLMRKRSPATGCTREKRRV